MSVPMTGRYVGNLKTVLRHGPSGAELTTAAPVDNRGDGSSFSPTDLVGAALGSCMLTTIAIVAEREGIGFPEASFELEKRMRSDPRRIDAIPVTIRMPAGLSEAARRTLEAAARGCPVQRSLSPEVSAEVCFLYADDERGR